MGWFRCRQKEGTVEGGMVLEWHGLDYDGRCGFGGKRFDGWSGRMGCSEFGPELFDGFFSVRVDGGRWACGGLVSGCDSTMESGGMADVGGVEPGFVDIEKGFAMGEMVAQIDFELTSTLERLADGLSDVGGNVGPVVETDAENVYFGGGKVGGFFREFGE